MCFFQPFREPLFALPDVCSSGIVRSIRKPERDVAAVESFCYFNAVKCVLHRPPPYRLVGIAKRSVFVLLILKKVGIDGTGSHAVPAGELLHLIGALYAAWTIPQYVQSHRRTDSSQKMYLASVAELLLGAGGGGRLDEFAEASSGVGEPPGRKLDAKCLKRGKNLLTGRRVHGTSLAEGRYSSDVLRSRVS